MPKLSLSECTLFFHKEKQIEHCDSSILENKNHLCNGNCTKGIIKTNTMVAELTPCHQYVFYHEVHSASDYLRVGFVPIHVGGLHEERCHLVDDSHDTTLPPKGWIGKCRDMTTDPSYDLKTH